MGYLWGAYGIPVGCLCDVYGLPLGCLWDAHGILLRMYGYYGMPNGYLWDAYGIPVGDLLDAYGMPYIAFGMPEGFAWTYGMAVWHRWAALIIYGESTLLQYGFYAIL